MADLFPPFPPSPGSASLAVAPSTSSSAENSPPTTATRPSPSPRLRREQRRVLHPLADDSDDGYSPHPSIYEASPVASDDESRDDKEPLCGSYDSTKQKSTELLEPEHSENSEPTGRSRNFSRFSGLSMMETIAEQKSITSIREEMLDGGAYSPPQQDTESEDGEDEQFYYDYASPTQPLHPVMSASAPNLGGLPYLSSSEHPISAPAASTFFSRGLSSSPRSFPPHQPTFRPALSMNRSYGTLSAHPFHRAPVLVTIPDSYTENQRTPDSLESPINRSRSDNLRDVGIWERLCRGICLVCCCVNINEDDYRP